MQRSISFLSQKSLHEYGLIAQYICQLTLKNFHTLKSVIEVLCSVSSTSLPIIIILIYGNAP